MTVETANWSDGLIGSRGRDRPYAVVVTSVTEAKEEVALLRTNREDYDPITFIQETEFDDSYLILIEWMGASSSDDLTLSRIERREEGLHVTAEVIEACGAKVADVSAHSLFIRVTDETEKAPARVTVHVNE